MAQWATRISFPSPNVSVRSPTGPKRWASAMPCAQAGLFWAVTPIRPGDTITPNVFEKRAQKVCWPPETASNAIIETLQVDDAGFIFVPYAGRIRAAGQTPEALRRLLTPLRLMSKPRTRRFWLPAHRATARLFFPLRAA